MTNGLPVGLPLLCRRPIKKIIFFHYPRVSPGAAPLTKKPEDSGYEIGHGKTYFSTAKLSFPRQNLLFHGKTYFSTAKLSFPRQNLLFHGKTFFSTAKLTFPRQNFLFHGKTYFSTAKLSFPHFRNPVSLCLQFPAILDPGTSDSVCTPADLTSDMSNIDKLIRSENNPYGLYRS